MTNKKVLEALNIQLNEELNSSYIYMAMAADFESKKWLGFSTWMKKQADEEMIHVWKLYNYIFSRGGRAIFKAIGEPKTEYDGIRNIFEEALKHEEFITGCVDKLVKLTREENDLATESLLRWYVDEQVEEENNLHTILDSFDRTENNPGALYLLDQELGKRVITLAPGEAQ
ncbi:MAG: ferritin [Spirochaetaceae bacterium]|jgi:ferritin|nr:ferritin [Spirochaetaceae bacterium]